MTKEFATTEIAIALFSNRIESLETKLNSRSLKNELKYHASQLNEALAKDFADIASAIQAVVNSRYCEYYEVTGYQYLSLEDYDSCVGHNLRLLSKAKKLLKFIE